MLQRNIFGVNIRYVPLKDPTRRLSKIVIFAVFATLAQSNNNQITVVTLTRVLFDLIKLIDNSRKQHTTLILILY